MRVGELSALRDDAVFRRSDTFWLRIPIGKLHNDRNVPLHPVLVELIDDYRTWRGPSPSGLLVVRDDGRPFDRRTIHRYVAAVARRAGTGHVHPHQLRHTLATQLINRGMSLEAIAELLGHRSPRMTLVYARISNDSVAQQYFRAVQAVEAVGRAAAPDEDARMLAQSHHRQLGNGHCARPAQLNCSYQTICEGCGFFETGPEFLSILRRQQDNATDQADFERAHVFNECASHCTSTFGFGNGSCGGLYSIVLGGCITGTGSSTASAPPVGRTALPRVVQMFSAPIYASAGDRTPALPDLDGLGAHVELGRDLGQREHAGGPEACPVIIDAA
jgi:Phage integrase family